MIKTPRAMRLRIPDNPMADGTKPALIDLVGNYEAKVEYVLDVGANLCPGGGITLDKINHFLFLGRRSSSSVLRVILHVRFLLRQQACDPA